MKTRRRARLSPARRRAERLLLPVVAALAILASRPAHPTTEPREVHVPAVAALLPEGFRERPLAPNQIGCGELLVRTDTGLIPLPMLKTDVTVEVAGIMSHGTVIQEFTNPASDVIEAIYVFPLPEKAAVHSMEIRIGRRRIVSEIQEREEAKRTYERARATGRKAALVEQERPNLFTVSVANINPGERIDVRLEYLEEVAFSDGGFELVFPLTFTPRFIPDAVLRTGAAGGPEVWSPTVPDAGRVTPPFFESTDLQAPRASIRVDLDVGFPLEEITCVSHEVSMERDGAVWHVAPSAATVLADRDFILRWRPQRGRMPQASLLVESLDGRRYALLMVIPPQLHPATGDDAGVRTDGDRGLPTTTMFVIDVSGSMAGPSIVRAREALLRALDRFRPEDRFNIIRFNNRSYVYSAGFLPGTPAALSDAKRWVRGLAAEGGTMIYPALLGAVSEMSRAEAAGTVERIVFLTDGAVGNEPQMIERITAGLGRTRLHAIGIGFAPNRHLIRKMTEAGHGLCDFISGNEDGENEVDRFFARLDRPVMTDLVLTAEGLAFEDVYPRRLPDLHAGEPIVVSARVREGEGGTLVVRGRTERGDVAVPVSVSAGAPARSGIATRWARAKVESVMAGLYEGADAGEVRERVVEVGLAFHLVTRYTSLVAVEETPTAEGPSTQARVANALPHGSQLLGGGLPRGGTSAPLRILLGLLSTLAGLVLLGASRLPGRGRTARA
jgi:Ca-activated chloride channel family protein